jgi:propanediol dehydratase large subunit
MLRHKVAGDFLQTSAVVTPENKVMAAIGDNLNDYQGPGTGYRLENDPKLWNKIKSIPQEIDPQTYES